ncbi:MULTISPECIES: glycerate kinase [unclassified Pseudomonas]|uniref:glycerate kinase n=1 Tax=unclassified Pseudomonas TaxID=196821 RepID=UPI000C868BD8|nr:MULTISPECIES: glycerate kinase [unclassified Pseudomonas]PMV83954.1 glycerate kinase [Pseudomonas sp. GW101-1A09]PMV89072.1 glycerate kinase [Pseudomonas sp. FW306-2-2C-B10A]PMW02829.1 glycerate kinase [Pseudomonas sp. GW460-C8]PMW03425.1 glycerate kinase [Pseudomonas sp. MPR-TSA4]PMW15421.1 glycerate kinase [Pseudomonas sp. GW456-E6]
MKIVIAPDSFKDSLSAQGVADAIAVGLAQVWPDAQLVKCPMADGGEGTVESILAACEGELRRTQVRGPLGITVDAAWGWLPQTHTAIIEMAEASGLQLVPPGQRDACISSTFGTGELIRAALDAGAQRVILAIGGSATNDGGAGAMQALGVKLLDVQGQALAPGGLALAQLACIDLSAIDPRLTDVRFDIAADVNNPLCGPHGASAIFGPQKGASPEQVLQLDAALGHFAEQCAQALGKDVQHEPGSGAAGGLGFAAKAFLEAQFKAGVEVVAELVGLAVAVKGADLVITGEGRFDAQTLRGKTPFGVARIAREQGVPVIVIAGTLGEGYQALYEHGIDAAFALASGPMTLEQACAEAPRLLRERASDIARVWRIASRKP